jgi:hypothetical protein
VRLQSRTLLPSFIFPSTHDLASPAKISIRLSCSSSFRFLNCAPLFSPF